MDETQNNSALGTKAYEEVGTLYRFFLTWRHASVAGVAAVAYGAVSLALAAPNKWLAGLTLIMAALVCVVLWLFDVRTRELYRHVMDAGASLEKDGHIRGFYTQLKDLHVEGHSKLPLRKQWPLLKLLPRRVPSVNDQPEGKSVLKSEVTHSGALTLLFLGLALGLALAGIASWWI